MQRGHCLAVGFGPVDLPSNHCTPFGHDIVSCYVASIITVRKLVASVVDYSVVTEQLICAFVLAYQE